MDTDSCPGEKPADTHLAANGTDKVFFDIEKE